MLERPKRDQHRAEFFTQVEPGHVSLDEMNQFLRFSPQAGAFFRRAFQHLPRDVQAHNVTARFRDGHRDPAGAAAEFEHGIAVPLGHVAVEGNVLCPPKQNRRMVVILGNKTVVQRRRLGHSLTTASASISRSISGEIRLLTSTMDVAGRMSLKNSPWPRATFSQSAMLMTKMRVRTTSFRLAPAFASAVSILRMICTVWTYGSPMPRIWPSGPVAVVPETLMWFPMRTARE